MTTTTIFINNEFLEYFKEAVAAKAVFHCEYGATRNYVTTVTVTMRNKLSPLSFQSMLFLGILIGEMAEKAGQSL